MGAYDQVEKQVRNTKQCNKQVCLVCAKTPWKCDGKLTGNIHITSHSTYYHIAYSATTHYNSYSITYHYISLTYHMPHITTDNMPQVTTYYIAPHKIASIKTYYTGPPSIHHHSSHRYSYHTLSYTDILFMF